MNDKREKTPTMSDIAKKVGVSRQLVSFVLNNAPGPSKETREKVLQAAKELNYHPHTAARMLRSRKTGMIGVIYTMHQNFHNETIEKLYPLAKEKGYSLILSGVSENHSYEQAVDELIGFRSEAIIIMDSHMPASMWAKIGEHTPVIIVGRKDSIEKVDYVEIDDKHGVFQAVDHLINLGHRRIAFLAGSGIEMDLRKDAYLERMYRHGLREYTKVFAGLGTEESGCSAARAVIEDMVKPTAILASNDRGAIGLMHTLKENGIRIPDDISVVGYDDSRQARLSYVNLTTVHQDIDILAEATMRLLFERLEGKRDGQKGVVFMPELVVRGTTSKCIDIQ